MRFRFLTFFSLMTTLALGIVAQPAETEAVEKAFDTQINKPQCFSRPGVEINIYNEFKKTNK